MAEDGGTDGIDAAGLDAAGLDASGLDLDAMIPDAPVTEGADAALADAGTLDAPMVDMLDAPMLDAPMLDAPMLDARMLDARMLDARGSFDAAFDAGGFPFDAPIPGTRDPRCDIGSPTRYDEIGSGTSGDPYLLCNAAQFQSFLSVGPSFSDYRLGASILLSTWTMKPSFDGTLDGDGQSLAVTSASEPMIGSLSGTVENLLLAATIEAAALDRVGAVAQTGIGTIRGVYFVGSVTGQDETGGLMGQCTGCTIEDVRVQAMRIVGRERVGGIIGDMSAGGITGAHADVTRLEATTTTACSRLGGIVGYAHEGTTLDEVMFEGQLVMAVSGAGGIVGELGFGGVLNDAIVDGDAVVPGGAVCTTGVGGMVGNLSGGTVRRGWARLPGATAGLADQVSLGGTLRELVGLTPSLGSPVHVLRTCSFGTTVTNVAVFESGTPVSGTPTCAFTAPRIETTLSYFYATANAPMSSWDRTTIWRFTGFALPELRAL